MTIICLFMLNGALFESGIHVAAHCDHRFAPLRNIKLFQSIVEDHTIHNYRISIGNALRSATIGAVGRVRSDISAPPAWQSTVDDAGKWRKCGVCDCDPTWLYITHGDAARSTVTHNCRSCGVIVCAICSPSADSIPAEGVGNFETLSDYRIPLPQFGLYSPQRVCAQCYLGKQSSL